MNYNIHYSIAAGCFLLIISWFYLRQNHLPILRSYIYRTMMFGAIAAVFLEVITVTMDMHHTQIPLGLITLGDILFLLATQLGAFLLSVYTFIITGYLKDKGKRKLLTLSIPYSLSVLCILLSPFGTWGAFYLDASGAYYRGLTHIVLYVVAFVYLLISMRMIFHSRHEIANRRSVVIYVFILIVLSSMLIQFYYPHLMLNNASYALAVMMVYCSLELPSDRLDPLTGAFNRNSAHILLDALYEEERPFSLLLVSMKDFKTVNVEFGNQVGDLVLQEVFRTLHARYPKYYIFRCEGDVFGVILRNRSINKMQVQAYFDQLEHVWDIGQAKIHVTARMGGLNYQDCNSAVSLFSAVERILQVFHAKSETDVLVADAQFFESYQRENDMEKALERAVEQDSLQVVFQPIHYGKNQVMSMEALARLIDPVLGFISPDDFIRIAEQNGSILQVGEQIFHKVCHFVQHNEAALQSVKYVSVNLSMAQCMQEHVVDDYLAIVRAHSIDPQKLCLEITETESTSSFARVRHTMEEFSCYGFRFSLDDFGTGYANFQYLSELPFANVKLDKSLLWSAMNSPKQMNFLHSVARAMESLELMTICEGVENEAQISILEGIGVRVHQGYFYSRPLPEADLLAYLGKVHSASCGALPERKGV